MFLYLKSKKINSCIYNYRSPDYSIYGISRSCYEKYIKFFLDNQWATVRGKDLILKNVTDLYLRTGRVKNLTTYKKIPINKKMILLRINKNSSKKDILNELRLEIIKEKKRQKDISVRCALDLQNANPQRASIKAGSEEKLRLRMKCVGNINLLLNTREYSVGLKKIGKHLHVSASTASRLMTDLHNKNRIKKVPGSISFLKEDPQMGKFWDLGPMNINHEKQKEMENGIKSILPPGCFIWKGKICSQSLNSYVF